MQPHARPHDPPPGAPRTASAGGRPPARRRRHPALPRRLAARRRAGEGPARPHDARREDRAGRRRSGSKDPIADANGTFVPEKAKLAMPARHRPDLAAERGEADVAQGPVTRGPRESATFLNDVQTLGEREHAPRHPGDDPRGGAARPRRAEGHALPDPDRPGVAPGTPTLVERVMSVAALEARARGTHSVLVAGARPRARPALGPHRGDLRRGPLPRLAARRRGDPRLPGLGPPARRRTRCSRRPSTSPVHGPHEGGVNTAPANFGERELRDQYLFPFEAAFTEAKPMP